MTELDDLDVQLWLEELHREWTLEHEAERKREIVDFIGEELDAYEDFVASEDEALWRTPNLHRLPYRAYLHTEVWKVRAAYAKRWGLCMRCGRRDVCLDCHHKTYVRLRKERPSDLVALCRECHSKIHGQSEQQSHTVIGSFK